MVCVHVQLLCQLSITKACYRERAPLTFSSNRKSSKIQKFCSNRVSFAYLTALRTHIVALSHRPFQPTTTRSHGAHTTADMGSSNRNSAALTASRHPNFICRHDRLSLCSDWTAPYGVGDPSSDGVIPSMSVDYVCCSVEICMTGRGPHSVEQCEEGAHC